MSGPELGLAVLGAIDVCIRCGNDLLKLCDSFRNAERYVAERVLCIKAHWNRTRVQLDVLRRLWQVLDGEHQLIQIQIIQVLNGKLNIAVSRLETFLVAQKQSDPTINDQQNQFMNVKRLKYAFFKDKLDATIEDLAQWQKLFDPSWFFLLTLSNPQIDTTISENNASAPSSLLVASQLLRNAIRNKNDPGVTIWRSNDSLTSAHIADIPLSSAKTARRADSSKLYILDTFSFPPQSIQNQVLKDVRELAKRLREVDPIQFGLLKCSGVIRNFEQSTTIVKSVTFIYKIADNLNTPCSLRAKLMEGASGHSLSDRVSIAKDLAKSVSFVHTFGFVHKNIRPENILLATANLTSLGHSFLLGFHEFRNAEGNTLRLGDSAWEKNLYRHPSRQGPRPDEYYIMQHDIYSLGICLFEIGMWESLILYDRNGLCVPSPILSTMVMGELVQEPSVFKDCLIHQARTTLPMRVGTKYAKVVETCLTCLDRGNIDFGDVNELHDEDGILVGVRFIEKILLQLSDISI